MWWDENFTSILREKGYKIIWKEEVSKVSPEEEDAKVRAEFRKNGKLEQEDLKLFLKEECDVPCMNL